MRERLASMRTAQVTIGGVTTEYVNREDHDDAIKDAQIMISNLELELRRVRTESDWRWYHDHIEAIQRRYEAELDLYRIPPGYERVACTDGKHSYHVMVAQPAVPFVPVSEVKLQQELGEARKQIDVLRQVIIDMCPPKRACGGQDL